MERIILEEIMEKDKNQKPLQRDHSVEKPLKSVKRRDVLKSIVTVPVLGAMAYGWWRKKRMKICLIAS